VSARDVLAKRVAECSRWDGSEELVEAPLYLLSDLRYIPMRVCLEASIGEVGQQFVDPGELIGQKLGHLRSVVFPVSLVVEEVTCEDIVHLISAP